LTMGLAGELRTARYQSRASVASLTHVLREVPRNSAVIKLDPPVGSNCAGSAKPTERFSGEFLVDCGRPHSRCQLGRAPHEVACALTGICLSPLLSEFLDRRRGFNRPVTAIGKGQRMRAPQES